MNVGMYLEFEGNEITSSIPYNLIAETFNRGSRPNKTGLGKRLFNEMFDESEKESLYKIIRTAKKYAMSGCPNKVKMTPKTYDLWQRLAKYCIEL